MVNIKWAGSSAVEQEPFKLLVTGSNPVRLTTKILCICTEFFVDDLDRIVSNLEFLRTKYPKGAVRLTNKSVNIKYLM